MSENTKIEWCDHSWSPWRGCTKISPGCAHCYAETLSKRNPAVLGQWGKGKPRVLAKNWHEPVTWNRKAEYFSQCLDGCRFYTTQDGLSDFCPICGCPEAEFARPRVFPSLLDWLDDEVPIEWLADFLKLIHDTPNLDWLLLTKRPENWEQRIIAAIKSIPAETEFWHWLMDWRSGTKPPANVWFGVSIEDQQRAVERFPALRMIPAKVRFLSIEPLLGPIDLTHPGGTPFGYFEDTIHWMIIGGESGGCARPCNVEWVRSLVKAGKEAGVPVFVKQLGQNVVASTTFSWPEGTLWGDAQAPHYARARLVHKKGGTPGEWPADLRVREFPKVAEP